jgi:GntR family transcriptional regulator, carbon starvation induced regulator
LPTTRRTEHIGVAETHERQPKTLGEAVYARLREDILNGVHRPGAKLMFAELTLTYSTSMGTLREVLTRLAADRLVVAEGQRGFRVAPISLGELWDITRLRSEMEAAALVEAIDHGDDAWEAQIVSSLHMLSKVEGRESKTPVLLTEQGARLHKQFHFSLIAASPSVWRLRVVDVLYDHSERYRRLQTAHMKRGLNSRGEHEQIASAVIGRRKRMAVKLMMSHLQRTAEMLASIESLW